MTTYSPTLDFGLNSVEEVVVTTLSDLETAVETAISNAALDDELSTGEALELQYELAKWALLYETSSNIGKKIDDAIANTVANMR
ncbi:hypothetical protein AB1L42_01350 [Thalassoglobus sp. JC818]|uniref:hypothetical protein n=1 Tax=Thalassoglobus sp. JC818 TaxID=3232136 RepID=UPI00345AD4C1